MSGTGPARNCLTGFNRGNLVWGLVAALLCAFFSSPALGIDVAPVWVAQFGAPGETYNQATAIAADANGSVFVTGYSYNAPRNADYWATIAYSGAGTPLWTNYFGPAGVEGYAKAIAVDFAGNVFVTGNSASTNAGPSKPDYATIKYSNAGVPLWTNRYNGPGDNLDYVNAIAVDGVGDVLVTGYSARTNTYPFNYDFATVKYSSTGVALWTNRYNGPQDDDDQAVALAVDHRGNVFVTGSSMVAGSPVDYATIAYSSEGLPLWTNRYGGPWVDYASAVAVDGEGNVFVTGYSAGASSSDYGYLTIKYSNGGTPLWTNRYDGGGRSYARAIALNEAGDVYVTGASVGNHYDFVTVKYSKSGVALWTNRWNGPANSADLPAATALDSGGNVFVTGRSSSRFATLGYTPAGAELWTMVHIEPWSLAGESRSIVVDGEGNVFVTGYTSPSGGSSAYATVKYASSLRLTIKELGNEVVLTWASTAFGLQSGTAITGAFTNIAGATSPYTNSVTGSQQFFRLISN